MKRNSKMQIHYSMNNYTGHIWQESIVKSFNTGTCRETEVHVVSMFNKFCQNYKQLNNLQKKALQNCCQLNSKYQIWDIYTTIK